MPQAVVVLRLCAVWRADTLELWGSIDGRWGVVHVFDYDELED